ncbi:MAG: hypothetical protein ISR55_04690 [Bacteroidetes bacterium]|nr:hypothetical protein [Bacteroidota bacterium]
MKFKLIILILVLLSTQSNLYAQIISISDARTKTEGSTVTVNGVITAGEFGDLQYVQDATGGIAVYSSSTSGLKRGDSVSITGILKDYYGELEISPVNSFLKISNGHTLPQPKLLDFSAGFAEKYEGQLVRFNQVRFSASGTFNGGSSGNNYELTQASIKKEIRVLPQTDLVGNPIPTDEIDIIGIMGHYKNTFGTDKYQLKPRAISDLILGKGPTINSKISQSNIQKNSFTLSFTTKYEGNTIFKYGLSKDLEIGTLIDPDLSTNHSSDFVSLSPSTFYYVVAFSIDANGDTSESGLHYFSTASLSSGNIHVYFNKSVDHTYSYSSDAIYLNKSMDDSLVAYLNRADESIDMAIYNLNNYGISANISTALNNAHKRGVQVRVIGDGSTANFGLGDLTGPSVLKSPQGQNFTIMHNKFIIIDAMSNDPSKSIVWTGSTNLTEGQLHEDPNNVMIIQDQAIAKAYTLEFEEMWGGSGIYPDGVKSKFGKFKSDNTPHFFNVGGKLVELYFSPSDQVQTEIINSIKSSDYSIYFGVYSFTRTEISNALTSEHNEGSYVAGIFGNTSGSNATPFNNLVSSIGGAYIKEYSNGHIFHHKYCIVDPNTPFDDPIILTGSHNWSAAANTDNDENTLIVHDYEVANQYFQEWAKRFAEEGGIVFVGLDEGIQTESKTNILILNNELLIHIESTIDDELMLNLYDLYGRIIYHRKIQLQKGKNAFQLPVSILNQSFYLVHLHGDEFVFSQKLFRQ